MTALAVDATISTGTFAVAAAFAADPGVTVLLGPSGSGKSVTLAGIAGLLRPNADTIRIGERIVADAGGGVHVRTQERRTGMVFQDARGGAGHLTHSSTSGLSGGEQQRIALARVLVAEPAVLLLDEPFSALDGPTRSHLRDLVGRLVLDQDLTAVLVTHDLDDITHLADRVVRYTPGRTLDTIESGPDGLDLLQLEP